MVIELTKPLQAYGFELIVREQTQIHDHAEPIQALELQSETDEAQLSFELERPAPRLRIVRRHPSI